MPESLKSRRDRWLVDPSHKVVLTPHRDPLMVRLVVKFQAATGYQLRTALGLEVSRGNRVLRRLFDAQLLRRHSMTLAGSPSLGAQAIYTPGPAAAEWIAQWEDIPIEDARKRCRSDRAVTYLHHALSIFDLYLALLAALEQQEEWELREFLVERQGFDQLILPETNQLIAVRPDAVAVLKHRHRKTLWCLALESDFHHVRATRFSAKILNLKLYINNQLYKEAFHGVEGFTVLTVAGSTRRIAMLSEIISAAGASSFCLLSIRPALEKSGFLSAIWHSPEGGALQVPLPSYPISSLTTASADCSSEI